MNTELRWSSKPRLYYGRWLTRYRTTYKHLHVRIDYDTKDETFFIVLSVGRKTIDQWLLPQGATLADAKRAGADLISLQCSKLTTDNSSD